MIRNNNIDMVEMVARNVVNGVLTIPKNVVELSKSLGDIIANFDIKHIQFEEGSLLKKVDDLTFFKNKTIESVDFSNCKELEIIGESAFEQIHILKNVTFAKNSSLKEIKDCAFFNSGITELNLSNSNIKIIGKRIVGMCKNLKIINFSNCQHLIGIDAGGFANCLVDGQYDLVDLSGCKNILYWGNHCINTKVARFDYNINSVIRNNSFYTSFLENNMIEIWDKGKKVFEFNSDDERFSRLQPLALGLLKYARSLGYKPQPLSLINVPIDKREVKLLAKDYRQDIENITKQLNKNGDINEHSVVKTLRFLGFFGFSSKLDDEKLKQEIIVYKNLLAKDYLKHYPPKDILDCKDKKIIAEILQRKTNKLARKMELKDLVLEFVKNNILPSQYSSQILNEFLKMRNPKIINLPFAEFFVYNLNDIVEKCIKNVSSENLTDYTKEKQITLSDIYHRFAEIVEKSNKKIITRSDNQRLTLSDCDYDNIYDNILPGNEKIASLCGANHISQKGFEFLQALFEDGKKIANKQILISREDDVKNEFSYEFIDKTNPIGLVLGDITNCCQAYDEAGQQCVELGYQNPNCAFVAFKQNNNIIGQSYLWYDEETKTLALDNIEIPDIHNKTINKQHSQQMLEVILRFCKNTKNIMDENGHKIENIIIGKNATDLDILSKVFPLETDKTKMFTCPIIVDNKPAYTDVNVEGQFVVCKDGKFLTNQINNNQINETKMKNKNLEK